MVLNLSETIRDEGNSVLMCRNALGTSPAEVAKSSRRFTTLVEKSANCTIADTRPRIARLSAMIDPVDSFVFWDVRWCLIVCLFNSATQPILENGPQCDVRTQPD